jgi:hypothetical protein
LVLPTVGSGLHFEDDFEFDRRTKWKSRHTTDEARRDGLVAEDAANQLRRRVGRLSTSFVARPRP